MDVDHAGIRAGEHGVRRRPRVDGMEIASSTGRLATATMVAPARRPDRLVPAETVDDVLRNLDQIIAWAAAARSPIGYFAVLYKRSTMAVRAAIDDGLFEDGPRMARFDVIFAQRYFDALNAYFHPQEDDAVNLAWEVTFVGDDGHPTVMLQEMFAGLNVHIGYDLGMAAAKVAPHSLTALESDFNLINALVASQARGVFDTFEVLSPSFKWFRRLVFDEVRFLRSLLVKFREGAWLFAIDMSIHPEDVRVLRTFHASWTAAVCAWYLKPPGKWTPFPRVIRAIAKTESRDFAANLRALDAVANHPAPLNPAYL